MIENLNVNYLDIMKKEEVGMFNLSIKWHYNIALGTPIELVVKVVRERFAGKSYLKPQEDTPAVLVINREDRFDIPYSEFIHMFMPMGHGYDIRAETKEKLEDMFDFTNTEGLLGILSHIGACEIIDFNSYDQDPSVMTSIRENKLIKIGLEKSSIPNGWTHIGNQTYCYSPMSSYVIWGSAEMDDVRIIMY